MPRKLHKYKEIFLEKPNSSPRGGNRACLCWEEETYKIECCDGSLHAQGIGNF